MQKYLQHRGHEVDGRDVVVGDHPRQVGAVAMAAGLRDDELNRRALAAVLQWTFKPGVKDGRPVSVIAMSTDEPDERADEQRESDEGAARQQRKEQQSIYSLGQNRN